MTNLIIYKNSIKDSLVQPTNFQSRIFADHNKMADDDQVLLNSFFYFVHADNYVPTLLMVCSLPRTCNNLGYNNFLTALTWQDSIFQLPFCCIIIITILNFIHISMNIDDTCGQGACGKGDTS